MLLKDYLIAILVFAVVITGFWSVIVDTTETYNVTVTSEYNETYTTISDTMADTRSDFDSMRDSIRTSEAGSDEDQYGGSLLKGAFNSLRLVWNSFTSVNVIVEQTAEKIGIPGYMVLAFLAIVIIAVSLAIIGAVFGRYM